jgi:hypothetical protein
MVMGYGRGVVTVRYVTMTMTTPVCDNGRRELRAAAHTHVSVCDCKKCEGLRS